MFLTRVQRYDTIGTKDKGFSQCSFNKIIISERIQIRIHVKSDLMRPF